MATSIPPVGAGHHVASQISGRTWQPRYLQQVVRRALKLQDHLDLIVSMQGMEGSHLCLAVHLGLQGSAGIGFCKCEGHCLVQSWAVPGNSCCSQGMLLEG